MKKKKGGKELEKCFCIGMFFLGEIKNKVIEIIRYKIWAFLCLHPITLAILPIIVLIIFIIIWYFIMNS